MYIIYKHNMDIPKIILITLCKRACGQVCGKSCINSIERKDIRILPINWFLRPRLARLRNSILFIDDFDGEFSVCVCNVGKKLSFISNYFLIYIT